MWKTDIDSIIKKAISDQDKFIDKYKGSVWMGPVKHNTPTKKNKNPEELLVKEILQYFNVVGFSLRRYESKAKKISLMKGATIWKSSGLGVGTPDILGICPSGYFAAIECKAPGRRIKSALSISQRMFLMDIINHGGFGICTDNVDHMNKLHKEWIELKSINKEDSARKLLKRDLPASS